MINIESGRSFEYDCAWWVYFELLTAAAIVPLFSRCRYTCGCDILEQFIGSGSCHSINIFSRKNLMCPLCIYLLSGAAGENFALPSMTGYSLLYAHHRHYIQRLSLPAYAVEKICTVMILSLPTAQSVWLRWGQLLVNLYINPKLIFMTLSHTIYIW